MNKLLFNMALLTGREDWLCSQLDNGSWKPDLTHTKEGRNRWLTLYQQGHFKLAARLTPAMDFRTHPLPWWCDLFDRLPEEQENSSQERCLMAMLKRWEEQDDVGLEKLQGMGVANRYHRWSTYADEYGFDRVFPLKDYVEQSRPGFWGRYLRHTLKEALPEGTSQIKTKARL